VEMFAENVGGNVAQLGDRFGGIGFH
jgi:hypothetical protein